MILSAGTSAAADGILIAQKMTSATGTVTTHQIEIEKTRMRAESVGAGGHKTKIIFDGNAQVMRNIDDDAKTYTEMSKADMEKMSAQMSGAMAQMQEQMKNMPPEARKRMEEAMRGRGVPGGGAAASTEYKKIGTDKVGKWTCDKYEGYEGGKKTSEVCTVDPKVLGFSASDFEISRQLVAFFRKLVPQIADQTFTIGTPEEQGFSGVPVRRVFTIGGQPAITEILEISRREFADSTFAVPEGFQKQEFLGAGRGR
jgi:hypothetical protein